MTIAVASGKGGTGKTTVATNLAWILTHVGHRITLIDCDVEEPEPHRLVFMTLNLQSRWFASRSCPLVWLSTVMTQVIKKYGPIILLEILYYR